MKRENYNSFKTIIILSISVAVAPINWGPVSEANMRAVNKVGVKIPTLLLIIFKTE